ncbi:unnamed protein product [Durusdinium trenchii]|uniref:Uncharacterized protein n=1 Tax=Durusdinium trenchii TaxID=1381693 RepID=A0ABP0RWM2_9DINO
MGDGTLLSAERPYVVACAYATWLKTSSPKGQGDSLSSTAPYLRDIATNIIDRCSLPDLKSVQFAVIVRLNFAVLARVQKKLNESWWQGKDLMSFRENIFLPVLFKPKGSYIQFVLYDLDPQKKPIAFASITLSQAWERQLVNQADV